MRTTLLVLLLGLSYASKATYNTIALTGYNRDIVANGAVSALSSISPGMTGGFDSAGYALVAQDYNFGGYTPSYYLPTGGVLNSTLTPSLNFQLADYSANNALRLKNAGDTGLLTFGTPQVAGALYILGTTGSGDAMLDMAVHFSDGTSQLFTGITYPDWYSAGGSITGIGRVSTVDNHTEGTSADPSLYEYVLNLDPTNYAKLITGITITKTTADGIAALMAVSASSICSGTPTAGSASASVTSGCSSFTTTLSLAGSSTESGISYQWQSSADGTTWTNITGATASTYNANVSANTFFRAYLACSVSGLADTSTNTEVTETGPSPVVATLPFNESFESWTPACYSFDRPGTNWLDSPPTGNASWRRDDQGSDASWDLVGSYMYTPTSTAGSHSARFHSGYAYPAGSAGNMDLYANLSAVGTKRISLDYTNASGSDYLTISLSEDGGSTFTTLGTYYTTSGWESEAVTTTSTAANAIIRVQGVSDYGSTDLGVDNFALVLLTPCTGTPAAGAISSSQLYGCSEFNAILSLPVTGITGLSYQWQSSADSATWTDVSGATSNTYTADVTTNIYYRVYVTCTASSLSDTSAGIHLLLVTPVATNATLPFFESFESWIGTCYMFDRPGSNWLQSPVTDNNSWRRDDQGSDAAWHNPDAYMYDPASTDGSRSARFHSGWAYPAGSIGNLDLHIDLSTPGTKLVRFDYNNLNGDDYLNLQLSEDGGSTFTTINTYSVTPSGWMAEIATLSSVAANAVLRFQAVSDYGGTDIGIDSLSVSVAPDCSGAPVAGTYTASQTSGCSAYSAAFSVDAPLYMTGISYQWQSSPDGVSYTDVAGATNTSYTASITGNMYYRFYAACSFSGLADTSAAIELTETPEVAVVATLPYFQSFESWLGGCTSFDRPDNSTLMTPTTGNTSWRRDDQGDDAMWDASGGGSYFAVSTDASHSARFHSYEASSGSEGDMDIHLDLSGAGMKNISFDIINEDGDDYMNVQLSEDGGATFSTLGTYYTYASWTPITLTTKSVAANAVLRFAAIGDFGGSDIGLDSLSVSIAPSCAGSPTAGTVLATQTSGCTAYTSTVSASTPLLLTGITYQWQSSPDGTTYTDVSGATNTSYTASVSGNIYYRFYVTCTLSGLSDTSSAMELIEEPEVTVAASLPYFQGFEDWMGGCSGYDRPDISWLLNPVTGNASWRRDDQGADAAWTYADYGGYTPVSIEGSHSARFHTYEVASGETGSMDLHVNLSMPGTKNISFYYNNSDGDDSMYVMLSEDGGTTFNVLQGYGTTTDWGRDTLSTSSVAANAVIRFYAISDYGYTDIGIDSLYISAPPAAPCATPTGLAATAITSTSAALSWSSVSGASGYEYVVDNTASTPSGAGTSTSATSADATSLTCATVYYLHVLTDCAADSSGWATISFTTDTCSTLNTGIINDADLSVLAYPNPAKNLLTVEIKGATGTNQHVQVTDVTGKVLMEETPANNKLTIDMSQFASGMYFVIYSDDANKRTIKVNKQ